ANGRITVSPDRDTALDDTVVGWAADSPKASRQQVGARPVEGLSQVGHDPGGVSVEGEALARPIGLRVRVTSRTVGIPRQR
ncbi:MAG: hypothetical protein LC799_10635, partial [Actinobacteria bacterium]|nr:hypothetical protein [Actinomycetota bacterium]